MTQASEERRERRSLTGRLLMGPSSMRLIALAVVAAAGGLVLLFGSSGRSESVVQTPTPKGEIAFKSQPRVRVLLANHTHGGVELAVKVTGPYTIMETTTLEILAKGPWLPSAFGSGGGPIQAISNGIVVSVPDKGGRQKTMHVPRLRIMPSKPGTLCVGARAYRGVLDIVYNHDGTMTLVNEVNLEDYIAGVVTCEMFYYWPTEALQAQAIVARSYTLALLMENQRMTPRPEWDVESGYLANQEYQGVAGEHPFGIAATQATEGLVIVWKGSVFRAYFHSCCGGHTEACGLVWDDYRTIPPLAGTVCEYCKTSKWYDWTKTIKLSDIEKELKKAGKDAGEIRDLRFADANGDGHMDVVTVVGSRETVEMKGNEFRLALHGNETTNLRSMLFKAKRVDGAYEFTGHGWGHGVGMCQYGAYGMAALMMNHERIIKYYYPETELWKVY